MWRVTNVIYAQTIRVRAKRGDLRERAEQGICDVLRRCDRLESKSDDFTIPNQVTLIAGERETASHVAQPRREARDNNRHLLAGTCRGVFPSMKHEETPCNQH